MLLKDRYLNDENKQPKRLSRSQLDIWLKNVNFEIGRLRSTGLSIIGKKFSEQGMAERLFELVSIREDITWLLDGPKPQEG